MDMGRIKKDSLRKIYNTEHDMLGLSSMSKSEDTLKGGPLQRSTVFSKRLELSLCRGILIIRYSKEQICCVSFERYRRSGESRDETVYETY